MCEVFSCPSECLCKGYSVYCNSSSTIVSLEKLPNQLVALYLHYSELVGFHQQNSLPFTSLVILDVAHCQSFGSISSVTLYQLSKLRVLNLQNTSIITLRDMLFVNLHSTVFNNSTSFTIQSMSYITMGSLDCLKSLN